MSSHKPLNHVMQMMLDEINIFASMLLMLDNSAG